MPDDAYQTIEAPAEGVFRERGSRFLAFAYPVHTAEEVKKFVDELRKKYYDATHHCFAYRLGVGGVIFRVNDDGEPSGTAGRPILGQMMSAGITNCLIVVVRYFGGTKLGVSGLIDAYKQAAAMAIDAANIIEETDDAIFSIEFAYVNMNDVMRVIKEEQPKVVSQHFDNVCTMTLSIRKSRAETLIAKLDGLKIREFDN